jgi:hypothetical protein
MRPFSVPAFLFAACVSLKAAAPANDNFSSRTTLSGGQVTTIAVTGEATEEAGENTRNGLFGATVWWSWQAPASGWVRVDTLNSSFDTVLQISTGTTVGGQTPVAFNDDAPGLLYVSSITFMATAGTVYNISAGGYFDFSGPGTGTLTLHITSGAQATPAFYPSSLSFSPALPDVTNAPVNMTVPFVIQSSTGAGTGVAGVGFGWEFTLGDGDFAGDPAFWNASLPQSGSPQLAFTLPRYMEGRDYIVWFKIVPDDGSRPLIFTGPDGGSGYAMPPPPAVIPVLHITNDGPTDTDPPNLTGFTITPSATVTSAPATLQISATLTDAPAGASSFQVSLRPNDNTLVHDLITTLTRSAGTAQAGTWTGSLPVPLLYPTDDYSVHIEIADAAANQITYGWFGSYDIPGGNIDVAIIGGSAYEEWAYSSWFAPGDANPALMDDADSDGNPNLISYAFDLNPRRLSASTGSLPQVEFTGTGAAKRLRITYLRRKNATNSGLTYSPQFTSNPSGVWQTVSGGTVTSIDATWERVAIDDTVSTGTEPRRFARVKVDYIAP